MNKIKTDYERQTCKKIADRVSKLSYKLGALLILLSVKSSMGRV